MSEKGWTLDLPHASHFGETWEIMIGLQGECWIYFPPAKQKTYPSSSCYFHGRISSHNQLLFLCPPILMTLLLV